MGHRAPGTTIVNAAIRVFANNREDPENQINLKLDRGEFSTGTDAGGKKIRP